MEWTDTETKYLQKNVSILPVDYIAQKLGRTQKSLYSKIKRLGLAKEKPRVGTTKTKWCRACYQTATFYKNAGVFVCGECNELENVPNKQERKLKKLAEYMIDVYDPLMLDRVYENYKHSFKRKTPDEKKRKAAILERHVYDNAYKAFIRAENPDDVLAELRSVIGIK